MFLGVIMSSNILDAFQENKQLLFINYGEFSVDEDATYLDWSPEGQRIAVWGSIFRTVKVYSIPQGKNLGGLSDLVSGNPPKFTSANELIVAPYNLNSAFSIWNLETGKTKDLPGNGLDKQRQYVDHIVLNVNRTLALGIRRSVGSGFSQTVVYDTQTWKVLYNYELNTQQMDYSPDSTKIIAIGRSGAVDIVDAKNGNKLLAFQANENIVSEVRWSPDGTRIATRLGGSSGYGFKKSTGKYEKLEDKFVIQLWDARTGKHIAGNSIDIGGGVESFDFSSNKKWLVTISADGTCRLWNADTLEYIETIMTVHPSSFVRFSNDSSYIAIINKASSKRVTLFRNKNAPESKISEVVKIIPSNVAKKQNKGSQSNISIEGGINAIQTSMSIDEVNFWYKDEMDKLNKKYVKNPKKFLNESQNLQKKYQEKLQSILNKK